MGDVLQIPIQNHENVSNKISQNIILKWHRVDRGGDEITEYITSLIPFIGDIQSMNWQERNGVERNERLMEEHCQLASVGSFFPWCKRSR